MLLVAALAAAACGGDEPEAAAEPSPSTTTAAAEPEDALGRCAVDARDGAAYGRITEQETNLATGERMYRIEGEGGVTWNKNAANVRVADCP